MAFDAHAQRSALRLHAVRFGYAHGPVLLNKIDLTVRPGEVHAVLGPSGCGKSTLLRLIAGLEHPAEGEIRLRDALVCGRKTFVPPHKRRIGYIFQEHQLFPHLSAIKNIMFGMRGSSRKSRVTEAEGLLDRLGLKHRAAARPHELSGGERQRIAAARALARRPDIVLLDEPFASLDDDTKASTRSCVMDTIRESAISAILVTHDKVEATTLCNRCWILHNTNLRPV